MALVLGADGMVGFLVPFDFETVEDEIAGSGSRRRFIRQDELHSEILVEQMAFQFRPATIKEVLQEAGDFCRVVDEKWIRHPDGEPRHKDF